MTAPGIRLPKDALSRISLGQSFAEYDQTLLQPSVFVVTPAIGAAMNPGKGKCFFVGRRGTGKTAITYYLEREKRNVIQLLPQTFAPLDLELDVDGFRDTRQRPFRSLVSAFKRAIQDEVLVKWNDRGLLKYSSYKSWLARERNSIEELDFDERTYRFVHELLATIAEKDEKGWLRLISRHKDTAEEMEAARKDSSWNHTIVLDRVDESWDGSDQAVVFLMALMHACVELSSSPFVRPLLFLRENIFERVRAIDNEFARLETFVVSLEWTQELLLELVERRLNVPFNTKLALRGPTWDYFFESVDGESSQSLVFNFCQHRPRDVLTYCSFAIESAQARRHERIRIEDLQDARRRFSDSRLKDLGDEYSENYPQIQLVLSRFYGLGVELTLPAVEGFIRKLFLDEEIRTYCGTWIYGFTTPERFVQLFFNIGFWGIRDSGSVVFRSSGAKDSSPPPITQQTHVVIHPSYADALNLQNIVISALTEGVDLRQEGLIGELPNSLQLDEYQERLKWLLVELQTLPLGLATSAKYEDLVGEIIQLCFYTSLTNVEPKSRTVDGRVIRDWIAANHASLGFWEMIRQRYQATQIIWECKNFSDLDAGAFQQAAYYMTPEIGRFCILCFRGEVKKHYYEHIRRIAREKDGGIVLLLTDKDLAVFLRQAKNGRVREDHIRELYDATVRRIS